MFVPTNAAFLVGLAFAVLLLAACFVRLKRYRGSTSSRVVTRLARQSEELHDDIPELYEVWVPDKSVKEESGSALWDDLLVSTKHPATIYAKG